MEYYEKLGYTKEDIDYFLERDRKTSEFAKKHSVEEKKIYKAGEFYIVCIKREYDECMRGHENSYGVQVWESTDFKNPKNCIMNEWFLNKDEANKDFLAMKDFLKK